jgi:hypothetical protein
LQWYRLRCRSEDVGNLLCELGQRMRLLLGAGLPLILTAAVVAHFVRAPTAEKHQCDKAADLESMLEPLVPETPVIPPNQAIVRRPVEREHMRTLTVLPAAASSLPAPTDGANSGASWVEPVDVHTNIAALNLTAAFQDKAGDRVGADRSRHQMDVLRTLLPAELRVDASTAP